MDTGMDEHLYTGKVLVVTRLKLSQCESYV